MAMHSETVKQLLRMIHDSGIDKSLVDSHWKEIQKESGEPESNVSSCELYYGRDTFSVNGRESVKEMVKLLGCKYNLKSYNIDSHSERGTIDAYYKISRGDIHIYIENHDTNARNDFGLITTENIKYSDEASAIIQKWDSFGKSKKRKQYYFKGKNIKETLSIIDTILS